MKLNYIYSSRTGLKRNANEDYVDVFEVDDALLAVVCDGLGGNNAGEVASKLAVTTIQNYFLNNTDEEQILKMINAITTANNAILAASEKNNELRGMATTVVALLINQTTAVWGHVGDSRIYFYDESGIEQITKDHSYVQKLLDDGYITPREAEIHPHKNVIMRALGEKPTILVDAEYFNFSKTRPWKFLLCTDGVSNVIKKHELQEILVLNDLEKISKTLSSLIEERGAPDNYSYVVISNQT